MRNVAFALVLKGMLMFGQPVKPGRTSVRADSQFVEASVLHLKGNVAIATGHATVQADEATFNVATGDVEARGNLRFAKPGQPVKAVSPMVSFLRINTGRREVMFGVRRPHTADRPK